MTKTKRKSNAISRTQSKPAEPDEFELTRQRIAAIEQSAVAFVEELRKLPLWQQKAIVDEVYEIANHGLRYMRLIVAGIQCERSTKGLRKPQAKNSCRNDFAKKFVEVWSNRTTPNGEAK